MPGNSADWFYAMHPGEPGIGPVPFAELCRLAAERTITATHLVRNDGSPCWVDARLVPGLISDADVSEPSSGPSPPTEQTKSSSAPSWLGMWLQSLWAAVRQAGLHFVTTLRLGAALLRRRLLSWRSDRASSLLGERLFNERLGKRYELDELQELVQTLETESPLAASQRRRLERRRDRLFHALGTAQLALAIRPESCHREFQLAARAAEHAAWQDQQVVALKKAIRCNDQSQRQRLLGGYALVGVALLLAIVGMRLDGGGERTDDKSSMLTVSRVPDENAPSPAQTNSPLLTGDSGKSVNPGDFLGPNSFRRDAQGNILTPWTHDISGNQFALAKLGYSVDQCLLCSAKRSLREREDFSDKHGFGFCASCGAAADALFVTRRGMETGTPVSPENEQAAKRYGDLIAAQQPFYAHAFLMWRDEVRWEEAWQAFAVLTAGPKASP